MNSTSPTEYRKEAGAEPLPGYRLVEPLGKGGFGEVWKCEVPGGLFKAIKFVQGEPTVSGGPGASLRRELEAFQSIKAIRHPFILSIERVELIDGEMLTVMELADKSLQDRLVECRAQGLPGVPREELLAFFLEAAEALDVMNFQYGLQHLDVKPHNLFVVSNHLKVGDFGLVNRLEQLGQGGAVNDGGVTPLYVAPEVLQNKIHRSSDQYNLALAYQELLTGVHPFAGDNPRKVMMAHLLGQPNLNPLPEADRPWVARALSKDPEQRFPSCMALALALLAGQERAGPLQASVLRGALRPDASLTPPGSGSRLKKADDTRAGPAPTQPLKRPPSKPALESPAPARPPTPADVSVTPSPAVPGRLEGYEMVDCLSRGALGEVWRVRAADGRLRLARLLNPALNADAAARERLHSWLVAPHHRALPAVELLNGPTGHAVAVTDAHERTLQERFRECHEGGAPGIPRAELLDYLAEAAEALDTLHERHQIQHLGLTPRHLLLEGDRLWIADFGLMELARRAGLRVPAPAGGHYLAPEMAEGKISHACDQYSLALIYAELLTGIQPRPVRSRPAPGRGRAAPKIDLDFLPTGDRDLVARALNPDPEQRFASCAQLFRALEAATRGAGGSSKAKRGGLPRLLPFSHLQGEDAPSAVLPSPRQFRDAVLAAATEADARVRAGTRPTARQGEVLQARFPMQALAGMARLKLDLLGEEWGARLTHEGDECYRLQLKDSASLWQRYRGQSNGVEVLVRLTPGHGGEGKLFEADVTIRMFGEPTETLTKKYEELGPLMLARIRELLQNVPERRADSRWPFDARVHVYPVSSKGDIGRGVEGKCLDVSAKGIRFAASRAVSPGYAFLHFPDSPGLAGFVLRIKFVRIKPEEDGCEAAAVFSLGDAPSQPKPSK